MYTGNFDQLRNFNHTYSLTENVKYYYAALTALDNEADDYHFILRLKSVQSFNATTGKINPFNFFKRSEVKKVAGVIGMPVARFKKSLTNCIKRGWIIQHSFTFNIKSIDRINKSLHLKTAPHYTGREYHPFTKLINTKGIDLNAHRIHELIRESFKQFKYSATSPNNKCHFTSSANERLLADLRSKKSKVKTSEFYAISMDTIAEKSGYSKNIIQLLIEKMIQQGLEVVKDKSRFNRRVKRACNKYNVRQRLSFVDMPLNELKKLTPPELKSAINYSDVDLKFKNALNNEAYRIELMNAGIIGKSYLRLTKKGVLYNIPKRNWSNMLIGILNNENLRKSFCSIFREDQINIRYRRQDAMFSRIDDRDERFGEVTTTVVQLVNFGGNYNGQFLTNYKSAVRAVNDKYLYEVKNGFMFGQPIID